MSIVSREARAACCFDTTRCRACTWLEMVYYWFAPCSCCVHICRQRGSFVLFLTCLQRTLPARSLHTPQLLLDDFAEQDAIDDGEAVVICEFKFVSRAVNCVAHATASKTLPMLVGESRSKWKQRGWQVRRQWIGFEERADGWCAFEYIRRQLVLRRASRSA